MARRNAGRDLIEPESDDYSFETTIPTDLSLSGDEASEITQARDKKQKISKQLLERKQLAHDLQLLKIELSQKTLLFDNLKADHLQKVEELEERLSNELHQKQILQARLESELKIQQEESRRRQENIQRELDAILKRQHQLEAANERLQERAGDIRRGLRDLELGENRHAELKSLPEEELSLRDFVAVKLYDAIHPLKTENAELRQRSRLLTEDLHKCQTELERREEELADEKRQHSDLQLKQQKMTLTLADTKVQVQHGNYKIENYDRVKDERDKLESELSDLRKEHSLLSTGYSTMTSERDALTNEVSSAKQTIALLRQDKDYLSKQNCELNNKLMFSEEKLMQLNNQLEDAKRAREEVYDKYVACRDQYKTEYENKLRQELEQIRSSTNAEIDRLKTSTREMYERENRNLREARNMAISEKERAQASERETNSKCEQLIQDLRQHQMNSDNRISELQNEVKIKGFEAERTQIVYQETLGNSKEMQVNNEKVQKKLDVLTKEYYTLQTSMEKRVSELEAELSEKTSKLQTYEHLEQELDDVVMQAAEVENEEDAERVLFSYGYGANVPTTAKRRLKQSVHLARRVLQLERANVSLKKEVERGTDKNRQLADELKSANTLLDQAQQPYNYLVESIRLRDAQINQQKEHIHALEEDVRRLDMDRSTLSKSKNMMASDLERLLNQKEEMSVLKQLVVNMGHRRPVTGTKKPVTPRKAGKLQLKSGEKEEDNTHKPPPTQFTKKEVPTRLYSQFERKPATTR